MRNACGDLENGEVACGLTRPTVWMVGANRLNALKGDDRAFAGDENFATAAPGTVRQN